MTLIERIRCRAYGSANIDLCDELHEAADELESLRAQLKEAELAEGRAKTRAMRLEMALADTEALELGTSERLEKTMAQLKEAQEAAEFNFQQYQDAGRLLCEAQAEIERLYSERGIISGHLIKKLHGQLAASQAREVQLREALSRIEYAEAENGCIMTAGECSSTATEALSLPSDTTALESMIQKAGEVMRERCGTRPGVQHVVGADYIRAIPGVTLGDLKGGAA